MLYPIMPIYLETIGFSVLLIGILEGVAEATAGLSKGYFGQMSDLTGKRVPFVQLGYALSAISKPMMAVFIYPLWIFLARTTDRFGKGIRTGARDALLSDEATPQTKARVFGFHRSMDTLGAVLGPMVALIYLYFFPGKYKLLFLIAFLPGLLAVVATLLLKKKTNREPKPMARIHFLSFLKYWKSSPGIYRRVVFGMLVFALVNSSDVFLILKVKQAGLDDTLVIGIYIFYNLIYAMLSYPFGIWADRIGLKTMYILGLAIFALVYFGMALSSSIYGFVVLFFLYGVYASATEGVSKAWISNISEGKDTATAIGTFTALQSISAIIASSLTGFIWYQFGAATAFICIAVVCLGVLLYLLSVPYTGPGTLNE